MKNKILALILALLLPLSAHAQTTHYSIPLATVGGSQNTWGTITNNAFQSLDTATWQASGGTTIGVNSVSGSANVALTNPINNYQSLTFTTTGKHVALPAMNATQSPVLGGTITFDNVGTNPYQITAADGATSVVAALNAGQSVQVIPLTNSTSNGTFLTFGPYLTSVSGNISLGTSVGAANPANGSAANTGLYTTATSNVGVTILGTSVALWNASGYNGAIGATTPTTGVFTTVTATNAAISGTTTVNNITINGTCSGTGCATGGIVKVSGQTFCASGCTHTAGTYTPTSGTKFVIISLVGGGGGGGGTAAGACSVSSSGGAGGYVKAVLTAAQVGTPTITLGAAGTAGGAGTNAGGAGGTTSVGTLLSATGGGAGAANTGCTGTNGGAGGTGTVTTGTSLETATGQVGGPGTNSTIGITEAGGSSLLGMGGAATVTSGGSFAGNAGTGFGSGGSGAVSGSSNSGVTQTGGAGTGGFVSIEEYQ